MKEFNKKFFFAIPNTGEVRIEMLSFLLTNTQYMNIISTPSKRPIYFNRNQYMEDFISSDCEWLLMIDSDTIPPINALYQATEILDKNKEIKVLSGWYNTFNRPLNKVIPVFFDYKENKYINYSDSELDIIKKNKIYEIKGCGGGFLIIHRDVINQLKKPYFKNIYNKEFTKLQLSEDLYLCGNIRDLGYKIYLAPQIKCSHIKYVNL